MAQVSIFVGDIRPLPESGRPTGMYKQPLAGAMEVGVEGFAGDRQADRKVHGGPEKAVHLYPAGHYAKLAARFPELAGRLVPGALGENLSTGDLDEGDVRIGDIWQLGSTRLQVCQPRNPCWKIDERLGHEGVAVYIAENLLTGWYWRVLQPGRASPGDTLDLVQPAVDAPTLREAMVLCQEHRPSLDRLESLARVPALAGNWRNKINQRLEWLKKAAAA